MKSDYQTFDCKCDQTRLSQGLQLLMSDYNTYNASLDTDVGRYVGSKYV